MENLDVARSLTLLADLLEIQGANPFRIRAYRNAVNTVTGLSRSLQGMVADGEDLTELPGIGKNVAAHIASNPSGARVAGLTAQESERNLYPVVDGAEVGRPRSTRIAR